MSLVPARALVLLAAGVIMIHVGALLMQRAPPLRAVPSLPPVPPVMHRVVLAPVAAPKAQPPAAQPVPAPLAVAPRAPQRSSPRRQVATATVATMVPPVANAVTARTAPPALLHYRVSRGGVEGEAELLWQPDGDHYAAQWTARLPGGATMVQTSAGGLGPAGLSPVRFVDRRPRRALAVNFQPDRGVVGFSAASLELPLPAGAQDRVSWMLQLAALVDADPALALRGIVLPVFGPRGAGGEWRFERVDGDADAGLVHLRRAAGGPYDAAVEVWLDPARHHLPARIVLHGVGDEAHPLLIDLLP